jgi:hypothetical protein
MIFTCCNDNRKAALLGNTAIYGIDFLEVVDGSSRPAGIDRQRTLLVTLLSTAPGNLKPGNVLITGGQSVTSINIEWIAPVQAYPSTVPADVAADLAKFANVPNADRVLVIRLDKYGDFSPYTLQFVTDATTAEDGMFPVTEVLDGFDPQLSSVTFSFKVDCGPEFDCKPTPPDCNPAPPTPPPINYLAKDYTTFRQVMLDRMNQLLPSWGASTEADIGVMLAEVVSYSADQLSYRQDAVTTEAYLNTARSRISLRRHARLVDYHISEGANARAWVQINVTANTALPSKGTSFYTSAPTMPATIAGNQQAALDAGLVIFEPMQDALLYPDHNLMYFYTWGDSNCCLPAGSTEATLLGTFSDLQIGDVLIFQEVLGPQTGVLADADLRHRCAVRLTSVATTTASGKPLVDPLFDIHGNKITAAGQTPQPVTEIGWSTDDALPFPVCISSTVYDANNLETPLTKVSVVLGNVVLADNGLTMPRADLGLVPAPDMFYASSASTMCAKPVPSPLPARFLPKLADSPITQVVPLPLTGSPSTPDAVALSASAPVSLKDGNGFITLQVSVNSTSTWPQYFGIVATPGSASGTFDLAVVFDPQPGGPAGVGSAVTLELFTDMNLTTGSPNYARTVLANSQFIGVPAGPPTSSTVPTNFPAGPTYLPNTGTVTLADASSVDYLTLQPTNPLSWPPLFSLISQQQIADPTVFNLLLLYTPPSGPEGVNPPVIAEQFNNMSLSTISTITATASNLISVETFEGEPNPSLSVADLMSFDAKLAIPAIQVISHTPDTSNPHIHWTPAPDLLGSGPEDAQFVVEIDTNGTAQLRFGDGTNGKMPIAGDHFHAIYRVGNGSAGNVGANCLINCSAPVAAKTNILNCTNPIAASGGIDPETAAQIRRGAPQAFNTQERAVTMQDYINAVELNTQIEDAAAQSRWTGSWYTVFIAAEPQANAPLTKSLRRSLTKTVNAYRLAGRAAYIEPPQYVPLAIDLTICVAPDSFSADVKAALLQVLGSCLLPSGKPAFFNPKNFELGQPVYLSTIYEAARSVPGLTRVTATKFEPQGLSTKIYLNQGYIPMGPFQVARLNNDPSLPGNGILKLHMQGGR